jgi:hypothetical protein
MSGAAGSRQMLSEAMLEVSLFVSHDNESRQDKAIKGMTCMIETALGEGNTPKGGNKTMILMLARLKSKGERDDDSFNKMGRFWLEFHYIYGYIYPDERLQTQIEKDSLQVRLRPEDSLNLFDVLHGFHTCQGPVDIIFDPYNEHGEWFPRAKKENGVMRTLAPMFRSNGIGYMKVGDDMNRYGIHFFSLENDSSYFDEEDVLLRFSEYLGNSDEYEDEEDEKPGEPVDLLSDEDIELFRKFVTHMENQGYFEGLRKGSDEYEDKFDILLAKFAERVQLKKDEQQTPPPLDAPPPSALLCLLFVLLQLHAFRKFC